MPLLESKQFFSIFLALNFLLGMLPIRLLAGDGLSIDSLCQYEQVSNTPQDLEDSFWRKMYKVLAREAKEEKEEKKEKEKEKEVGFEAVFNFDALFPKHFYDPVSQSIQVLTVSLEKHYSLFKAIVSNSMYILVCDFRL